ncbi:ComEC/Rec2 family competence protein [Oceanobacillus halotolerans]|uniref:ComEC/Rec2 family competence protein n=1 Tax=Oceanobacillus halotolerans TaxID=2663380 RepID=UPI0013DB5B93|nr:ComEC/Rec2 family competence protein [Oceanobacillus halotolerans]
MQQSIRITIIMVLFIFIIPISGYSYESNLEVHFIDVGQGDSVLVKTPNDKVILIDGGRPKVGKRVVNYLEDHHVNEIDLMISTHPDIDHIGGLIDVMKQFKVKQILDSGKLHSTATYAKYINEIRKQDIPFKLAEQGKKVKLDSELEIRILNSYQGMKTNNQSSIALKMTYGEIDFLLMGDVEKKQEEQMLRSYDVQAEIVKVAHHGSDTSTSLPFLYAVGPEVAMITYGENNDFGHPVNRVIDNLKQVGASIYSTATYGNVSIISDGESYLVLPEKEPLDHLPKEAS